ncbi:MAG: transposase [Candidatus Marinimicrobia bacterium]|nr:transposase [Candidatus Neomarinimicrobiota bacterium]
MMRNMESINRVDGALTRSMQSKGIKNMESVNRVDGALTRSMQSKGIKNMESINRVDGALTPRYALLQGRRSMQSKRGMESKTEYKTYQHNPPHLFIPNAKYFITASTYKGKPYLRSSSAKERLYLSLQKEFTRHHWEIEDWVILDNHYHLMVNAPENPKTLPDIFKEVHRFTALWIKKNVFLESINRVDGASTRLTQSKRDVESKAKKIFYNYRDTCITFEKSYFTRLNYIWYNPVKHGYVDSPEKWKFGSYYYRFIEEAEEMKQLMKKYPFDKVKIKDDF